VLDEVVDENTWKATMVVKLGPVAQYGRGVIPDVAGQMVDTFAENLAATLGQPAA
jgi:hypothetical protein